MKKMPISLLCGIAVAVVTVILYFVILGNIFLRAICLISLLAVLVCQITATIFAYLSNGQPRKVAAAIVSALSIPLAILFSIVYIVNFPTGYTAFIGLFITSFIICNVIAIILYRFDDIKNIEGAELQKAKSNMLNMRKVVKCIISDLDAADYAQELSKLEERLHFSNDNVIVPEDSKIYEMLIELQTNISNPEFDISQKIIEINKMVDSRNIMTSKTV